MRLGYCGSIEQAAEVKAAGFDFLEVNVQGVLRGNEADDVWERTAPDPAKLPLPVEAANCLVPGAMPIVGPSRDFKALQAYIARVTKRADRVGIRRLVFGSGAARKRPDGVSPEAATKELAEFTRMTGDACAANNVVLVIEHLHKGETNTLNALGDCLSLCRQVGKPSVQMLVDSFHFALEQEKEQASLDLKGTLRHVHVAEPSGRIEPGAPPKEAGAKPFDFVAFFRPLRRIGYDERVAVESAWTRPLNEAGPECVRFLRDAWDRAGRA
ncbi:MAG: sugar phosphate isomerase/epimerase [Planctomycetota bacterium]|nr:sugar phosphate isomerase/epimerase [Planctomycetota bacterium]